MNKYKNSFDFIGAHLSNNDILATEVSKTAFDSLKEDALRRINVPFDFSKGNFYEFIEGAKLKIAAAEKGSILGYEPTNAGFGEFTSPEDLTVFNNGEEVLFQAKVGNLNYITKEFADPKYRGMHRITTSEMYEPTKAFYERKLMNGTITEDEYDALIHLKEGVFDPKSGAMVTTSDAELEQLRGSDGKVDIAKVNQYIEQQQNTQFMKECINNTASVTLVSAISSCAISSATNFYKYLRNEQDIKTTVKNIGKDIGKGVGHGLLSSSIANVFKFAGYKTGNMFLRDNVNSLVIGNGVINIGKSVYHFSKGKMSFNDLLSNVSVSSFLTLANLGLNFILPGAPLIKLVSSIVLNMVGNSFLKIPSSNKVKINSNLKKEMCDELEKATNELNNELLNKWNINTEHVENIKYFLSNSHLLEDDEQAREIFKMYGIEDKFVSLDEVKEKIKNGQKIKLVF